jgi:hypothetical protein
MKRIVMLCLGSALCAAPLAITIAQAADKPAAKSAYKAPRNAFGQPDLGDSWSSATLTTESRPASAKALVYTPDEVKKLEDYAQMEIKAGNANTAADAPINVNNGLELRPGFAAAGGTVGGYNRGWLDPGNLVMRVGGEPRSSFLLTPDGRVPRPKPGVNRVNDNNYAGEGGPGGNSDNPENRTLSDRCLLFGRNAGPPMLPNGFYNNNYRFVQSKDEIAILVEMVHDVRHVSLTRKEHIAPSLRPWFGDSIGHWEGDTLVVETTNIPRTQAYNGSWRDLKVTEHFTRVAPDRLRYKYTIDDPTMWDNPFSGEYEFSPLDGHVYEYACHEGNYALEGILAGQRQIDRDAAGKGATVSDATRGR